MQQQIFLCIGQEATFHQDRRTGDVVHQIDAVRDGLCLTGVARVQCGPQCLLCELCQRLTELSVGIEHLSAVVLPVRKGILVYAEQDSMLRLLDPGHTVVEVRDFFLPEGLRTVIMEGDIFTAQQKRRLAIQPQKLIQLLNNLREQMYRFRLEYIKDEDKRQILQLEHEKILAALRLRHMAEAKAVARGHIDNQEITVLKNLKERKEV